jgi:hypothetical protein
MKETERDSSRLNPTLQGYLAALCVAYACGIMAVKQLPCWAGIHQRGGVFHAGLIAMCRHNVS